MAVCTIEVFHVIYTDGEGGLNISRAFATEDEALDHARLLRCAGVAYDAYVVRR